MHSDYRTKKVNVVFFLFKQCTADDIIHGFGGCHVTTGHYIIAVPQCLWTASHVILGDYSDCESYNVPYEVQLL
jgi:hypothetical protein